MILSGRIRLAILGAATVVLAALAGAQALSQAAAIANPELALALDRHNVMALNVKSESLLKNTNPGPSVRAAILALSRESIRQQAINPFAFRQMALVHTPTPGGTSMRNMVRMSVAMSRRDFGTQALLIQDAVERDDIAGALMHYDLALRVSAKGSEVLVPQLAAALQDEQIRKGFLPIMKAHPAWLASFLANAMATGSNPSAFVELVKAARGWPAGKDMEGMDQRLLAALIAKRDFRSALEFYLWHNKGKETAVNDVAFRFPTRKIADPLDWNVAGATDSQGNINRDGSLYAFAGAGQSAVVAQKYLFLPPGNYRLTNEFGSVRMDTSGALEWKLSCESPEGSTPAWTSGLLNISAGARFTRMVSIPASCRYQSLTLALFGGDRMEGSELTMKKVRLDRAN
jgi:hypothetical protein